MSLFLCALGAFFIVQGVKAVFVQPLTPWLKLILACAGAFGLSYLLFPHQPRTLVLYGFAGSGLAVLVHRSGRLLSVAGDWLIREIIRKRAR
jgi:hypothetical protein